MKDGDTINVGEYTFRCVSTPAIPRAISACMSRIKIPAFRDHILGKITPNISLFADDLNPLNDYLQSLDKTYDLEVEQVLPAHRQIFTTAGEGSTS